MNAHKARVDPTRRPAAETSSRRQPRTEESLPPRVQRVLNLIRRATRQSPVMVEALSDWERGQARQLFKRGMIGRARFDESGDRPGGLGYFGLPADDEEEPDPVTDFAGAVAYAGDLAALEADASLTDL